MRWRRHTGLAVRAMVRGDLAAIGFMMFTLLVIALAIDLAKWLETLRARAEATDTALLNVLLPYVGYRSTDIITRLLTMACLGGGFVVTLLRHQRLDDVVLAAAGAGPGLRLTALLITGALLGVVQMSGENWLRPAAVAAQVEANLGDYGHRYNAHDMGPQWVVADTRAFQATLSRGPEPALTNVLIFDGMDRPDLTAVHHAQSAKPTDDGQRWQLKGVTTWDTDQGPPTLDGMREVRLPVAAENVRWFGVDGYYLPNAAARRIAASDTDAAPDAATALAVRKTALFLPGIFAFLGLSLASVGVHGRRLAPFKLLALATVGYLLVVSVKVFWALGIHAVLPPMLAATIPAACALALAIALQLYQAGYLPRRLTRHP